ELLEVLKDQITQLVQDPPTLTVWHLPPRCAILERGPGRPYCPVHVLRFTMRDRRQNLLGGRVHAVESPARRGIHPLTVDQHLTVQRTYNLVDTGFVDCQGHRRSSSIGQPTSR